MSISNNNFNIPDFPSNQQEETTKETPVSSEIPGHSISMSGEDNDQISQSSENIIEQSGKDNTNAHSLPQGISISTSGGSNAQKIANNIIKFSLESPSTGLSKSNSISSLNSTQKEDIESLSEFSYLESTENLEKANLRDRSDSLSSISTTSSDSKDTDISPLPKYDPTSKTSIQAFLKDPRVLANMKEKGGHYIYPDESRSSFIFIPNGDFSLARSIKVTNGKTKANITNPADLEMCIAKYSVIYNEAQQDWQTRGSVRIRQNLGLAPNTPVNIKHFTLNLKYKQAIGYGELNSKEASSGFTPSAWRRGSKISVNKDVWKDVGGLNSVNLSNQRSQNPSEENIQFSTETPEPTSNSNTTPTGTTKEQQPVVININVAGGQGGQGGVSSPNITYPEQNSSLKEETIPSSNNQSEILGNKENNNNNITQPLEQFDSSNTEEKSPETSENLTKNLDITNNSRSSDNKLDEANPEAAQVITSQSNTNNLQNLLEKIRNHLDSVYDSNGSYVGSPQKQIRDIIKEHEQDNSSNTSKVPSLSLPEYPEGEGNNLIDAARQTSSSLQNLLGIVNNSLSSDKVNSQTRQTNTSQSNTNDLQNLLEKIRNHLDSVYDSNGSYVGSPQKQIRDIIKEHEQDSSSNTSKVPSLSLPEYPEGEGNNLIDAARQTSSSLQNLLGTINFSLSQEKSSSIPLLSLPEYPEGEGNNLIDAAQQTSSSLQDLLKTVTNANSRTSIPNPNNKEDRSMKQLLSKVKQHIDNVYQEGSAKIGGIAKVIKEEEKNNNSNT